jgi:hypothetical protein
MQRSSTMPVHRLQTRRQKGRPRMVVASRSMAYLYRHLRRHQKKTRRTQQAMRANPLEREELYFGD